VVDIDVTVVAFRQSKYHSDLFARIQIAPMFVVEVFEFCKMPERIERIYRPLSVVSLVAIGCYRTMIMLFAVNTKRELIE
jgi:hypothetical protein